MFGEKRRVFVYSTPKKRTNGIEGALFWIDEKQISSVLFFLFVFFFCANYICQLPSKNRLKTKTVIHSIYIIWRLKCNLYGIWITLDLNGPIRMIFNKVVCPWNYFLSIRLCPKKTFKIKSKTRILSLIYYKIWIHVNGTESFSYEYSDSFRPFLGKKNAFMNSIFNRFFWEA